MKTWRLILYGILIGLIASGGIILISQPARGFPIELLPLPSPTATAIPRPSATPASNQVQIKGEVHQPGVYKVPKDTRLGELINLSGGLTDLADELRINVVILVNDGDYFYIPAIGEPIPDTARNSPVNINADLSPNIIFPIDINQASLEEFESLPGIGPTKAAEIIAYRDLHGVFNEVNDLLKVPGIGPQILEAIISYVIVSN
jgi:competence protein ComEA